MKIMLGIAVLLASFVMVHGHPSLAPGYPTTDDDIANDILSYVNQHRHDKGLPALAMNAGISAVALQHSRDMAAGRTAVGHKGFSGRMKKIAKQLGPVKAMGENVAEGYTSAKSVVENWLTSAAHKENIEGHYTLTGIGVARDKKGQLYFTQIFILQ